MKFTLDGDGSIRSQNGTGTGLWEQTLSTWNMSSSEPKREEFWSLRAIFS